MDWLKWGMEAKVVLNGLVRRGQGQLMALLCGRSAFWKTNWCYESVFVYLLNCLWLLDNFQPSASAGKLQLKSPQSNFWFIPILLSVMLRVQKSNLLSKVRSFSDITMPEGRWTPKRILNRTRFFFSSLKVSYLFSMTEAYCNIVFHRSLAFMIKTYYIYIQKSSKLTSPSRQLVNLTEPLSSNIHSRVSPF